MRQLFFLLLTLNCCFVAPGLQAEGLDPTELAIVEWSLAHNEEAIALLEESVNINSGSQNIEGVLRVGALFREQLDELGFFTEWIEQPAEFKRAGHLFARHDGQQGKKILLIGHLDTVFEPDDDFQTFKREGSKATGPGTEDMKGGDVVIIYALKALKAVGALQNTQIVVAMTGDEESTGKPVSISRKALIEAGQWADIALGFEAGIDYDGQEWATIARRSSSAWCLEVTGRQAHSSGIFDEKSGAGAIFEAARILNSFYNELREEEYLTFNAGTILGGTDVEAGCSDSSGTAFGKTNVIPRRVVIRGGMRTISAEQLERTRVNMQRIVADHLPVTSASISFTDSYPAMSPTEGNRELHSRLSEINQQLGRGPMPILDPSRRGAADISFVAPYTDGLAGMGLYGSGGHTPDEAVDLDSIPIAVQRAAILIYRLTR